MKRVHAFFNLTAPFKPEWQDLRAGATLINVLLIMAFGLQVAWFGLLIAVVGLVKDCTNKDRHLNDFILHGSTAVLNIYFLTLL